MLNRFFPTLCVALTMLTLTVSARGALISHLTLDDTTLPSASANVGADGTYENFTVGDLAKAPAPALGSGSSVEFRRMGPPHQGINLGDTVVGGQDAVSMSAWVRFDNLGADHTIASKGSFGGNQPLLFWRDDDNGNGPENNTIAIMVTDTAERRAVGADGVLNNTGWHHVAFTYETNTVGGLRVYVDGFQTGSSVDTGPGGFPISANDLVLGIQSVSPSNDKAFDGNMDDVSIWDHALSASDITYLARGGSVADLGSGIITDTTVLTPDADAYVRSGSNSASNFGGSGNLVAKYQDDSTTAGNNRKSYVRFDISSFDKLSLKDAVFSLAVDPGNLGTNLDNLPYTFEVFGLNDGVGENWGEGGITWDNAPANLDGNDLTGDVTSLGIFTPTINGFGTGGQYLTLSGDALLTFLREDTNGLVTFIVRRVEQELNGDNTIVHEFGSKENSNPLLAPTLILATGPIPEPATFALLGLGGLAMLRRRRAA